MRRRCRDRALDHRFHPSRHQRGAVSIEALGFAIVLLSAFSLVLLIGSAYWNVTMLSTTASSASLASQALINTDCSAVRPSPTCLSRADAVREDIVGDLQRQLIFVEPGSVSTADSRNVNPRTSAQSYPAELGGQIPACWSYSFVSVRARFKPLGGTTLPVRGASLATGYQPQC